MSSRSAALGLALAALSGCAAHTRAVGLVVADPLGVHLQTSEGRVVPLVLDADSAPLRHLDHCVVVVEGPKLGRRVVVKDWRVQDAGDGSGNFVGMLRVWGPKLVMDDRNTGGVIELDPVAGAQLRPWAGHPVLVIGHVSAGGVVVPVAWRLLDDGPTPPPAAGPAD